MRCASCRVTKHLPPSPPCDSGFLSSAPVCLSLLARRTPQDAPFLWSVYKLNRYTLFDVYAKSGSVAVAVGGHPQLSFGVGSCGTIIYTVDGGIHWRQSVRLAALDLRNLRSFAAPLASAPWLVLLTFLADSPCYPRMHPDLPGVHRERGADAGDDCEPAAGGRALGRCARAERIHLSSPQQRS